MEQGFSIPIGETIVNNKKELAILELTDQNPHGILSGMTGSGKSELILTIITSITSKYSPDEINFAIIDFKAGSTSDLVVDFPHCAGVASDLEESDAIIRAISLLKAENARRQRILTDAVKKGIISKAEAAEYKKACEKDKRLTPLPLLLIIVDEYGELKKQYDKFDAELASIAKQGRSRFVYLLLADNESKTFHGVNANISYRICLGFSDISEIHNVLNTPIKKDDKVFIQYSEKDSEGKIPRGRGILNSNGKLIAFQSPYVRASSSKYKSQLDAFIVKSKLKYDATGNRAYCVLPEQLPEKYCGDAGKYYKGFDSNTGKYSLSINWNIPVGIVDDVYSNKHSLYFVNPPLENIAILGSKASGKTTLIKNIIFGVANQISPKMCNMLILNFGEAYSYEEYKTLPHICDILDLGIGVKKECKEKLERSISVLNNIINQQAGLFINERIEFLVFIDGYKFFADHYPKIELQMRDLITEGKSAGVSFIISCNKFRYISDIVRSALLKRVLLRSADEEFGFVYSGKCEKKPSSLCNGRSIVEDEDGRYYDMQISYPGYVNPEQYYVAISDYIRMYYASNSYRAKSIPYMPDKLSLTQVRNMMNNAQNEICFGIETAKLTPVSISTYDLDCLLIEGTTQSGKTYLVNLIIEQLKVYKDWCSLLIFDNEKRQHHFPNKPNIKCIDVQNQFDFISNIQNYVFDADKETVVIIDDIQSLHASITSKNKSVYDTFYQWIITQREQNKHIHFVIAFSAEANGYDVLKGFKVNEVVLLGNKVMMSRFAAPTYLKTATFNTTLGKNYAWISIADNTSCVKVINEL